MKHSPHILDELNKAAPLLQHLPVLVPFTAPEGYFEEFPAHMLLQAKSTPSQTTFSVPEGYFDNFASKMLSMAKASENEAGLTSTPLLDSIHRKMPYSVPSEYFKNFQASLPHQTLQIPVRGIFSIRRNLIRFSAVAAVLVMVITGLWMFNQTPPSNGSMVAVTPIATQLDSIDSETLSGYLDNTAKVEEFAYFLVQPVDDLEGSLEQLPTTDLVTFLENSPAMEPGT